MSSPIQTRFPVSAQWPTQDPFLFVAHHDDHYPLGNSELGPPDLTTGREPGNDFSGLDGWSMYHGGTVPGFPRHPHRGFETITFLRHGYIDHADSVGALARYGPGDVQWVTTGSGIEHSEMFPLLGREADNRLQLFQIWLNLPASDKMVHPYFTMFWAEDIPELKHTDSSGHSTTVRVIAGELTGLQPLSPPINSWAAKPESDLAIWEILMEPNASWTLPAATSGTTRSIYLFEGGPVGVDQDELLAETGAVVDSSAPVDLTAGEAGASIVVLQGSAIRQPVAKYGPFVMNTEAEIHQAFSDYRKGGFGEWSPSVADPNHGPDRGRFAVHADGRLDVPEVVESS